MNVLPDADLKRLYGVGIVIGAAYLLVGWITYEYPPDYLGYPRVWGIVFMITGFATWFSLLHKNKLLATVAGGLLVGAALFRGFAIFTELGLSGLFDALRRQSRSPIDSSFAIAGTTWILISILLWIGWPVIVARLYSEMKYVE